MKQRMDEQYFVPTYVGLRNATLAEERLSDPTDIKAAREAASSVWR